MFIIGGLNTEGQIEYHGMSRRDDAVQSYKPESKDDFFYTFLYKSETGLDLESKIQELADKIGTGSVNKRKRIQKELNNFVADHDDEVNKITFELRVRRT